MAVSMLSADLVNVIRQRVRELYVGRNRDVPFHGWHHVEFVSSKAVEFAVELGAEPLLVEASALVHDLNYLVDTKTDASGGAQLRQTVLAKSDVDYAVISRIESIVLEAETQSRNGDISIEAMALSDADTLFKALPITPVVLAPLYMRETGRSIKELALKIVNEQVPLNQSQIYFYSPSARQKYTKWGEANLRLWLCILEALEDVDVQSLLAGAPALRQYLDSATRTEGGRPA